MELITKKTSTVFGKKVFLLGKYKSGEYFWLEEGKWDCGWYWGFGYIKTYTNSLNPAKSHDINSHSHFNGFFGKKEYYDTEKKGFVLDSDYRHHLYDDKDIIAVTLTAQESWQLSDLMKTFYTLKEMAEVYGRGYSYLAEPSINIKNEEAAKRINEKEIPAIMNAVYTLLTPKEVK